MAYDIQDFDELQIYVTDGWREWYIPKFRIDMVVDGDFCYVYWSETEKGDKGERKLLSLNYNDVTFGYLSPSSAGEVEIQINTYIVSAWTNIPIPPTPDLDAVLTAGNDGGALEITNIADGSASTSAATVGQVNALKRLYALNITSAATTHTGTAAQTITYSYEIPANTIGLTDCLEIKTWHRKTTGASGNHTVTVYLNTSNAIGGDALLAQTQGAATTMMMEAFLKWQNSTTNYNAKNAAQTPWGSNVGGVPFSYTKDTTASLWVIVTVQLATTTDVVTQYMVEVIHHKNS